MSFRDFTTDATDEAVLLHVNMGLPRLGTIYTPSVPQDTPTLSAPLQGTGSLRIVLLNHPRLGLISRSADQGWTAGYVQTLINIQADAAIGNWSCGLFACATQMDLLHGAGHCYAAVLKTEFGAYQTVLARYTAGLASMPAVILAEGPVDHFALQATFTMRFLWIQQPGYTVLEYAQGSAEDFSDLATVVAFKHMLPSETPVRQGLFVTSHTANAYSVFWDVTSGRQLA